MLITLMIINNDENVHEIEFDSYQKFERKKFF